jgi:hypothetical protein
MDSFILHLPHVGLINKDSLPESSGIYYVLDDKNVVWYIGQARNLKIRWSGKNHHRFYQLQKQRKHRFSIYYELAYEYELDEKEKLRIEQYNPQLNGTKVKKKQLRPAETLLRETLLLIAPYSIILGIEPPRKEESELVSRSIECGEEWRVQKAVLALPVIHICFNFQALSQDELKSDSYVKEVLKKAFRKRTNFSHNWEIKPAWLAKRYRRYRLTPLRRLLVNGFAIEVYNIPSKVAEWIEDSENAKLLGVEIRAVSNLALNKIKKLCCIREWGLHIHSDPESELSKDLTRVYLSRISPYSLDNDVIKLVFNEEIDFSKVQIKLQEKHKTLLPARLYNLTVRKNFCRDFLVKQGIDLNLYNVKDYLEHLPKDENFYDNLSSKKMVIFIKPFMYQNTLKISNEAGIFMKKNPDVKKEKVYLLTKVEKAIWLLLKDCLSGFAKESLETNEVCVKKLIVSDRVFLRTALVKTNIEGVWISQVPFGTKDGLSFDEVKKIIQNRIEERKIAGLKFSFEPESLER